MSFEKFLSKWLVKINLDNKWDVFNDYENRFAMEYHVYFEHCLSYLNRLLKDTKTEPYALKQGGNKNICLLDRSNNSLSLFFPKMEKNLFNLLLKDINSSNLKFLIRSVSSEYLSQNQYLVCPNFSFTPDITTRSKEEVIISTQNISKLDGSRFGSLRYSVNKISKNQNLKIRNISMVSDIDARDLINLWQRTQGKNYLIDRRETDYNYYSFFKENEKCDNFVSISAYIENRPVALILAEIIRNNFAVCLMNKAINAKDIGGEIIGLSGLSGFLYYLLAKELYKRGVYYINLGSLGDEEGTRNNKIALSPVLSSLSEFQISYKKINQ
jgi:hypothetical protein